VLKKLTVGFVTVAVALTLPLVGAHPPAPDPHNSCVSPVGQPGPFSLPVLVRGTLSYLAPLGTSIPACMGPGPFGPYTSEWGSHAPACPPPPFVGAIPGAYCGPLVPPGGTGTCSWIPVLNTVPTQLIVGWDGYIPPGAPGLDGFVNVVTTGGAEVPVFGPFLPGAWTVPNPYPVPARVIGFPTDVGPFPPGTLAPGDLNLVICVTP
jgi:hypothetical protein